MVVVVVASGRLESLLPRRLSESRGNEFNESSSSPSAAGSRFFTFGLTSFLNDSRMEEGLRLDLREPEGVSTGVHSLLVFLEVVVVVVVVVVPLEALWCCCSTAPPAAVDVRTGAPAMVVALAARRLAQVEPARLAGRLDTLDIEPARVSRLLSNMSSDLT